jgi:hypothetical protein
MSYMYMNHQIKYIHCHKQIVVGGRTCTPHILCAATACQTVLLNSLDNCRSTDDALTSSSAWCPCLSVLFHNRAQIIRHLIWMVCRWLAWFVAVSTAKMVIHDSCNAGLLQTPGLRAKLMHNKLHLRNCQEMSFSLFLRPTTWEELDRVSAQTRRSSHTNFIPHRMERCK